MFALEANVLTGVEVQVLPAAPNEKYIDIIFDYVIMAYISQC